MADRPPSPPNVLLILTDQHRLSGLSCYRDESGVDSPCETPNIDRLAAEGVRFRKVYTTCPVCSPARATVMTGLYPHSHGIMTNIHEPNTAAHELEDRPGLLSRRLGRAGYRCGYTGKWHLGTREPHHFAVPSITTHATMPEHVGFEGQNFPGHGGGGWNYLEFHAYLRQRGLDHQIDKDPQTLDAGIVRGSVEATVARFLSEHTRERIEDYADSDRPWFIWHNFWGPHGPYHVPREHYDRYRDAEIAPWPNFHWPDADAWHAPRMKRHPRHRDWSFWERTLRYYYAFCSLIDDEIGRMIDTLRETGQLDHTVIVFAADHGETLGSHGGLMDKGFHHFEETHRIPLIVRYPDRRNAGETIDSLVSLADLYPTLLDLAGEDPAAPPREAHPRNPDADGKPLEGRSLLPLIQDPAAAWRDAVVTQFNGLGGTAATLRTLRRGTLKYGYTACSRDELYDLADDPHEMHNRFDDPGYARALVEMRQALAKWMERHGDQAGPLFRASRLSG